MNTIKKSPECTEKLKQLVKLFEEADEIFSSFTDVENHAMLNFHNEGASINHCVRWGLQAAQELLDSPDLGEL